MISVQDYLRQHGAGHEAELTEDMRLEAQVVVDAANAILAEFGEVRALRSGWRPKSVNDATPNAARTSKHITCQAIDIADDDGRLKQFAFQTDEDGGYPILEKYTVWAEYGAACPSWLHIQIVPPGSGKRVFFPNAAWAARAAAEDKA